ncbi:hypothetical protein ISS22_18325 [candidate division KSB1 bacterium]|nr:hypothetical protein [candidate division KSB1 bacterium]
MKKNSSLTDEIKQFQKEKKWYATALMSVGMLGLALPVIPGLLLIAAGVALISPKYGNELLEKIKNWIKSLVKF